MSLACDTCPVRESAACAVLNDSERAQMAKAGRTRELKRGETLFAAGDDDAACATLVSGALKVSAFDEEGNERILSLVHPAGFVGELFQPFAHHDVVALAPSKLCVFSRGAMEAALENHPALSRALLRRSQEDLFAARRMLEFSARRGAMENVANLLMGLANAASDSPCHPAGEFELTLTRGEMANMLGLTIETVSRSITRLERDGVIRRNGQRGIELLDPARLSALAGGG